MKSQPQVMSINISKGGIPKLPIDEVYISKAGLAGDGHNHAKHSRPTQAVSLQDVEMLGQLRKEGYPLQNGSTGENVDVCNININNLPAGTILRFSEGVVLELTRLRPPCYVLDAIDPQLKHDIAGRCGFYAQVLKEGMLRVGERIQIQIKRPLQYHDPAFHGNPMGQLSLRR